MASNQETLQPAAECEPTSMEIPEHQLLLADKAGKEFRFTHRSRVAPTPQLRADEVYESD